MASNFFDTAKSVKSGAEALLDRIKADRESLSALLASAKAAENRLIEKEQREQREQAEREKAERLKRFLESGESNAYVADEADQVSEATAQAAPEPPAEPAPQAEAPAPEGPVAKPVEQPAPQAEAPAAPAQKPAAPVQRPAAPAQKPAYVAREDRPHRDNGPRPAGQDRRPADGRPATSADRPRRDNAGPRPERPQGGQGGSRAVIIICNSDSALQGPAMTKGRLLSLGKFRGCSSKFISVLVSLRFILCLYYNIFVFV